MIHFIFVWGIFMKRLFLLGVFLIVLFTCVGCNTNKYNAYLFDDAREWIKDEFANANPTFGYFNENLNEDYFSEDFNENTDLISDESYPRKRIFLVDNQEKYEQIFIANIDELDINFNEQMLIIYTFTTIYHRKNSITNLKVNNQILTISYKMASQKYGVGDVSRPFQRWFVVKLDKLDITSVEFNEKTSKIKN